MKINTVAPKYRKGITLEEMEQIAAVNQIALNILEMEKLNEDKGERKWELKAGTIKTKQEIKKILERGY